MPVKPPINSVTLVSLEPIDVNRPENYVIINDYWFIKQELRDYLAYQLVKCQTIDEIHNPYTNQSLFTTQEQFLDIVNNHLSDYRLFTMGLKAHFSLLDPYQQLRHLLAEKPMQVRNTLRYIGLQGLGRSCEEIQPDDQVLSAIDSYINSYSSLKEYLETTTIDADIVNQRLRQIYMIIYIYIYLHCRDVSLPLVDGYYYCPQIHRRYMLCKTPEGAFWNMDTLHDLLIYCDNTQGFNSQFYTSLVEYGLEASPGITWEVPDVDMSIVTEICHHINNPESDNSGDSGSLDDPADRLILLANRLTLLSNMLSNLHREMIPLFASSDSDGPDDPDEPDGPDS